MKINKSEYDSILSALTSGSKVKDLGIDKVEAAIQFCNEQEARFSRVAALLEELVRRCKLKFPDLDKEKPTDQEVYYG